MLPLNLCADVYGNATYLLYPAWLQVALLDQLAAHAGLGAELQREEEQQGQGQQGAQGTRGWEGSSGTWWLACEEARQGKLLGAEESRRAGWLEDLHCQVVNATVVEWLAADDETAATVRVPARPPPLLAARLAARAAESLCRLCRGQGLEGAYAPAPEWELGMSQVRCPVLDKQLSCACKPLLMQLRSCDSAIVHLALDMAVMDTSFVGDRS